MSLLQFGARYHRYVQQDELGPSRAERMAALRALLDRLDDLEIRLKHLPKNLRRQLSDALEREDGLTVAHSILDTELADQTALALFGEVANNVGRTAASAGVMKHAEEMSGLAAAIEKMCVALFALDTTTESEIVFDAVISRPQVLDLPTGGEDLLSRLCAQNRRLRKRLQVTLDSLEARRGPDRQRCLTVLVWQLCDLWFKETGQPVTSSGVQNRSYRGMPQSAAGRFVVAAVEALHSPEFQTNREKEPGLPVRARTIRGSVGARSRCVHFSMRQYVTHHRQSEVRRGRPRAPKVTL
jgi:hypothetical protein